MLEQYPPPYLLAYSGGTDSLACLVLLREALKDLAPTRKPRLAEGGPTPACIAPMLVVAHLDHQLDPDSSKRARACALLAAELQVPCELGVAEPPARFPRGLEAWARDERYRFLEAARIRRGANWVITAHHADDQCETVLLRLLAGSRLWGLEGIRPRWGRVLRPLLGVRRQDLRAALGSTGLRGRALEDPTNADLQRTRNFVRLMLRPQLEAADPSLLRRLTHISELTAAIRGRCMPWVGRHLLAPAPHPRASSPQVSRTPSPRHRNLDQPAAVGSEEPGARESRGTCITLSRCIDPSTQQLCQARLELALHALHRNRCAPPHRSSALAELTRQLDAGHIPRIDIGGGWQWCVESVGGEKVLTVRPSSPSPQPILRHFAYNFLIPGSLWIPEIALTLRARRARPGELATAVQPPTPSVGSAAGVGPHDPLDAELSDGEVHQLIWLPAGSANQRLDIRFRRPGDRLLRQNHQRPKKLKDVLSKLQIPKSQRDQLPFLIHADRVVDLVALPGSGLRSIRGRPMAATEEPWRLSFVRIHSLTPRRR
jgi:tRNA(Ile)-lysidine synthase